jgi:hypothetical protein
LPAGLAVNRRRQMLLALLGAALVALTPLALAVHDRWDADYAFVGVVLVQGALYLLAARVLKGKPRGAAAIAIVLVAAAALRLSLLFEAPIHSTDIYRYVWDGRVQGAGINPYQYAPADEALAPLRDANVYPNINRADYAVTIYPPAAQGAFWLFTRMAETVWAVKLGWLLLEAIAIAVLIRLLVGAGRPPAEVLLYVWHPLPVWEIAGEGHVDAGMAAFLVFALLAWAGRRRLVTGVLLAISVLFKPLTLVAVPAFWKPWDWRMPAAFAAAALFVYLPYARIGAGVFGFFPRYVSEEGIGSGEGFLVLRLLAMVFGPLPEAATVAYLVVGVAVMIGLAVVFVRDRPVDGVTAARQAQVLIFAFLLVLSPNYPWYFLALVPLGCLAPWLPARVLTLLAIILYAAPPLDVDGRAVLVQSLLHASVMAALVVDLYNRHPVAAGLPANPRDGP